jgi:3-methyl-2-oxobutanoate hydroxymethyltransferase
MTDPRFRDAAPNCFAIAGSEKSVNVLKDECLSEAFRMMRAGGDAAYCAAHEASANSGMHPKF